MAGFGFVMFERLWSLMGMENALASMVACPDELDAFLDRICDYFCHLIDIALEYDFDGIYFGDDWGQQKGLIMGPGHLSLIHILPPAGISQDFSAWPGSASQILPQYTPDRAYGP